TMAMSSPADARLLALEDLATQLRVDSVRATTAAGSGHPTSCASGADLVAAIFFDVMRFDPQAPRDPACDRFVLSKGHAAPLLYAAWAAAGALDRKDLVQLRQIDGDLEGHPTPRLPFVDVATGSLGWRVNVIDGHDMKQVTTALRRAARGRGAPTAIVARTVKGKGLGAEVEGKEGWHGKPLPPDMAERVIAALESRLHRLPPPPI